MTSSAVISFHEFVQYPTSCYSEEQCTILADSLPTATGVSDSQCAYDAVTGCSCTLTSSQPSMSSGTYAAQGTNVTITNASTGKADTDSYCVTGNTAKLYHLNDNGTFSAMVLTK
jgi:hypothetical protein